MPEEQRPAGDPPSAPPAATDGTGGGKPPPPPSGGAGGSGERQPRDGSSERLVRKRLPEEPQVGRTHEMHKRQLKFAFRILAATLIAIAVVCASAVIWPPDIVVTRLQVLEATDTFKWMTSIVNTIVGGAIGLALGSYYSQNVGDR